MFCRRHCSLCDNSTAQPSANLGAVSYGPRGLCVDRVMAGPSLGQHGVCSDCVITAFLLPNLILGHSLLSCTGGSWQGSHTQAAGQQPGVLSQKTAGLGASSLLGWGGSFLLSVPTCEPALVSSLVPRIPGIILEGLCVTEDRSSPALKQRP